MPRHHCSGIDPDWDRYLYSTWMKFEWFGWVHGVSWIGSRWWDSDMQYRPNKTWLSGCKNLESATGNRLKQNRCAVPWLFDVWLWLVLTDRSDMPLGLWCVGHLTRTKRNLSIKFSSYSSENPHKRLSFVYSKTIQSHINEIWCRRGNRPWDAFNGERDPHLAHLALYRLM